MIEFRKMAIGVFALVMACGIGFGAELKLVVDGKANAVIAVPDKPSKLSTGASAMINKYIKLISGVALPIKKESELTGLEPAVISLGATKLVAQAGIGSKKLILGEFVCEISGKRLFIYGRDGSYFNLRYGGGENGTWNGACRFVEKCLGVRWLWPGAYGVVVPKSKTIIVSIDGKFSEKPAILSRGCRTTIYHSYWEKDWQEIGISPKRYKELSQSVYDWQKFQLLGGSVRVAPGGHGFTKWWEKYGKSHPEWFAMQTDGTRNQQLGKWTLSQYTVKLCVTNPEVVDQIVKNAVEHYSKDNRVFMAAINDGGNVGFCICDKCLALDKPEKAPPCTLRYKSGSFDYCSLSDRYVDFWNRIAEKLEKKCPGKLFSVSGYGCITQAPVVNKIKFKSILMSYVGFDYLNDEILANDRKWWDGWRAMMPKNGKMALRCNMLCEGYGLNYVYVTKMGSDFNKFFSEGKVMAIDNDSLANYWGTNGLNYYMLYKLMWNPSMDVAKETRDYCEKGFGKAAGQVALYFKELEKATNTVSKNNWNWKGEILKGLPTIYTPERIRELRAILEKAAKLAEGDDKKRVEFLMEGLEYTKIITAVLRAKAAGGKGEDYKRAVNARTSFFKNQKFPLSAPYPADKYWRSGTGNDLRK